MNTVALIAHNIPKQYVHCEAELLSSELNFSKFLWQWEASKLFHTDLKFSDIKLLISKPYFCVATV